MPLIYRVNNASKPRGVAARNKGIRWIVENADINGIMYFADDDNTYDVRLFDEVNKHFLYHLFSKYLSKL